MDEPSTRARLVVEPGTVAPDPARPGSGVVAVFAVVPVPRDDGLTWSVAGVVERWTGSVWAPAGSFTVALDHWGGTGAVVPPGTSAFVRQVGLGANRDGIGPIGWLDLSGLPPGTYRLVQEGRTDVDRSWGPGRPMAGYVDVVAPSAGGAQPPGPPPKAACLTGVAGVPAHRAAGRVFQVLVDPGLGWSVDTWDAQRREHLGELAGTARLDVRDPVMGAWTPFVHDLPVRWTGDVPFLAFETDLPALAPAGYRLVLASTVAGDLWAPFWAVAPD